MNANTGESARITRLSALGEGRFGLEFDVRADLAFDLDLQIQLRDADTGEEALSHHIRQAGWDVAWLPRGRYRAEVDLGKAGIGRTCRCRALLWTEANAAYRLQDEAELDEPVTIGAAEAAGATRPSWRLEGVDGVPVGDLSWNRGHDDWFFKHFDHAARVIVHLMLKDDPRLRGRILDVGCGDGMTDLGVFLRCRPAELVGVDPSERYRLLPEVAERNHLPDDWRRDERLRFEPFDGNDLPFEDDRFDVVLSWGSLEHIVGGYERTLREIRRVLRPDGLLFVHPGLYYGAHGNHLGEFFDDPWVHLKLPREELKARVLSTPPEYMDRGGEFASPEDYWQWYTELNPITVRDFERQIRDLGFEPWRVALRSSDLVEYTPELQSYTFDELATGELYLSAWNRKGGGTAD